MYTKIVLSFLFVGSLLLLGWYVVTRTNLLSRYADPVMTVGPTTMAEPEGAMHDASSTEVIPSVGVPDAAGTVATQPKVAGDTKTRTGLSQAELLALAGDPYASGNIPLGDNRYTTTGPKLGYVYLCNVHKDGGGAMKNGPWINGLTWNFLQKIHVGGSVAWTNAKFDNSVNGETRTLLGNALPVTHNTGTFPVGTDDPAYQYDRNPNFINAQSIKKYLPAYPTYSETPYCMGGEVGIMLTGVPLFNAFDAGLRDAPAHELQDSCDGHPQASGEYHYHSMSSCFRDTGVTTVLGYAYDGFPITGPLVAKGKYLTTEDLDECHGITSEIMQDGKKVMTYHYVLTQDFPYSASCFRGKPITIGPSVSNTAPAQPSGGVGAKSGERSGSPPSESVSACTWKSDNDTCSFVSPQGDRITGTCKTPPGQTSLACVPR